MTVFALDQLILSGQDILSILVTQLTKDVDLLCV